MVSERLAKHRASVLRPILELEKRGEPISAASGDAAWELGVAKSHAWSLYRRLRENDGRAAALELSRRGPKLGSKRIAQEVEEHCQVVSCLWPPQPVEVWDVDPVFYASPEGLSFST